MRNVTIRWDDINNIEQGYKIYRSESPMNIESMPEPIGTVDANITEYIDENQPLGTTNYYRVGAFVDNVGIEYSDELEYYVPTDDFFKDGSGVAFFRFDNNLNDPINDLNGTWVGTPQYISGKFNQAVKFTGNNVIELADHDFNTLFDYNSVFTISYWVVQRFFSFSFTNSLGNAGIYYYEFSDGTQAYGLSTAKADNSAGNLFQQLNQITPFNDGDHVIIMKETPTTYSLYRNGVLLTTINCTANGTGNPTSYVLGYLNTSTYSGERSVATGSIDQFRIFNRQLSESEILQLYNEVG